MSRGFFSPYSTRGGRRKEPQKSIATRADHKGGRIHLPYKCGFAIIDKDGEGFRRGRIGINGYRVCQRGSGGGVKSANFSSSLKGDAGERNDNRRMPIRGSTQRGNANETSSGYWQGEWQDVGTCEARAEGCGHLTPLIPKAV